MIAQLPGDRVLFISGSDTAGGLFVFDGDRVRAIDRIPTRGIAVREGRLFRTIPSMEHLAPASDLFVYDRIGIVRYARLDGVSDAHDVLPRDDGVLVVSSYDTCVHAIAPDGDVTPWWSVEAEHDAWHLNCLAADGDAIYATAFGMFDEARGWSHDASAATGVLLRLPSAQPALRGLRQPHSPRRLDGGWLLCNSGTGDLSWYGADGELRRERAFGGYTRGIAIDERYIYVAESAHHARETELRTGRVNVLARSDWSTVARFDVPDCVDIYELALGPVELAAGVAVGSATNPQRVRAELQSAMFGALGLTPPRLWAIGEPLEPASLRATLSLTLPATMSLGSSVAIPCTVTNRGDAIFVSAPPNPIELCYRWFDSGGAAVDAGGWLHTPLPRAVPPGETVGTAMRVAAPRSPGRYTLAVTLLQENVAWFDDVDPSSGVRGEVTVS